MANKQKSQFKRGVKVKFMLFCILCVIMLPLILGFVLVKDKAPKAEPPVVEQTTAEEATTQAVIEDTSEPVSEPAVPETTTAPAKKDAMVVLPTDDANWPLAIVSVKYPLPANYMPKLAAAVEGSSVQLDERVAPHYQEMYNAAKSAGCVLTPYSGYRSYSSQESTYNRKINYFVNQGLSNDEAVAKAQLTVAPAGCSEHNMGFSVDIVSASSDFVNTKENTWLLQYAQNYGFVLRYPTDKEAVTGRTAEPWHWRYVGVEAAKEMKNNNQCLEEYLGLA